MNKINILLLTLLINQVSAQSYQIIEQFPLPSEALVANLQYLPSEYLLVDFDQHEIIDKLKNAPKEFTPAKNHNITSIALPSLTGEPLAFQVQETKLMADGLAAKFPKVKTYSGTSQDGKAILKMAVTPLGISAFVRRPQGSYNIWPLFGSGTTFHALHRPEKSLPSDFVCGFEDIIETLRPNVSNTNASSRSPNEPVSLLIYDLAAACTGEFSQFFANPPTVEATLSGLVSILTAMNAVTELEMAFRYRLIDENDQLIFLDPNSDPYNNDAGLQMIGANTQIISGIVSNSSFDSGILFANRCLDGISGVASLGTICDFMSKGAFVTCNSLSRMDSYVSTTLHELGHHLSSGHTWNNCPGADDQRAGNQSYEPGSGSTIMSYAGLCGSQNIGGDDAYYHVSSLERFDALLRDGTGSSCPEEIVTNNNMPIAKLSYTDGFYIPIGTPFTLKGEAEDDDGEELYYNWEQYDLGPVVSLGEQRDNSPLFRSLPPSTSSTRTFPNIMSIVNRTQNNTEILPLVSRDMTFRFVVRDYHAEAGGVDWAEVAFKATELAGPFTVEDLQIERPYNLAEFVELHWNVAGTDDPATVNCQTVNIFLSANSGQDFDIALAQNVPNDGIEIIRMPDEDITNGRILVEADDNIFFNITETNFSTTEITEPGFSVAIDNSETILCAPESQSIRIFTNQFAGYEEEILFAVPTDLPDGVSLSFSQNPVPAGEQSELSIATESFVERQDIEFELQSVSGGLTLSKTIKFTIYPNDFSSFSSLLPIDGTSNSKLTPTFKWVDHPSARSYEIEISTSPAFTNEELIYTQANIESDSLIPSIILDENQLYYWRVRPQNECGDSDYSNIKSFHTFLVDCYDISVENNVNISSSAPITINVPLVSNVSGLIEDVNVSYIRGQHNFVGDLHAFLVSPEGTEVKLFGDECFNQSNFDIGFDDDAFSEVFCPISTGKIHIPLEPLSTYKGEDGLGTWDLRIEDQNSGGGGRFMEAALEICGALDAIDPILLINETLRLVQLTNEVIDDQLLSVKDENNTDEEVTYTLVENVRHGQILKNEAILKIGDQFTQADISSGLISYQHNIENELEDRFLFTVRDFEGGWIPITEFNISLENSTSTSNLKSKAGIKIYPNPTPGLLQIELNGSESFKVEILTLDGRPQLQKIVDNSHSTQLHVGHLSSGIYLARLSSRNWTHVEKILVMTD